MEDTTWNEGDRVGELPPKSPGRCVALRSPSRRLIASPLLADGVNFRSPLLGVASPARLPPPMMSTPLDAKLGFRPTFDCSISPVSPLYLETKSDESSPLARMKGLDLDHDWTISLLASEFANKLAFKSSMAEKSLASGSSNSSSSIEGCGPKNVTGGFEPSAIAIEELHEEVVELQLKPAVAREEFPSVHFSADSTVEEEVTDVTLAAVKKIFCSLPGGKLTTLSQMPEICKAVGFPLYWRAPFFGLLRRDPSVLQVTFRHFVSIWNKMVDEAHDEAARFVWILTGGERKWLTEADLDSLVRDVLRTHEGLAFFQNEKNFHELYIKAVTTKVFWDCGDWSGRVTVASLRKVPRFLEEVAILGATTDINLCEGYFSYECFYVLLWIFQNLDCGGKGYLLASDLVQYNRETLTPLALKRIFEVAVSDKSGRMDFKEFHRFLMAEENKIHPQSVRYWFRVLDIAGTEVIDVAILRLFYSDIEMKSSEQGVATLPFDSVLHYFLDVLNPKDRRGIRRADFLRTRLSARVINGLVSWTKFFEQECCEDSPHLELLEVDDLWTDFYKQLNADISQ